MTTQLTYDTSPTGSQHRPRRLSVSELLAAVQAAHAAPPLDDPDTTRSQPMPDEGAPTGSGASRSHAAPAGPTDAHTGPTTLDPLLAPDPAAADDFGSEPDHSWVPDHDGPVTLTDLATPRRTAAHRAPRLTEPVPSRPAIDRDRNQSHTRNRHDRQALAVLADIPPVEIGVLGACGGSGATTTTVLLGLALAEATGAAVVAGSDTTDTRQLATYCGVDGIDLDALSRQLRVHVDDDDTLPGHRDLPTVASATGGRLHVAAGARRAGEPGATGLAGHDLGLIVGHTACPAVLDLGKPWHPAFADRANTLTHLVLTAPRTPAGLAAAEFATADLLRRLPDRPLALLLSDDASRTRRPSRSALARLASLGLDHHVLPPDRRLAAGDPITWPALATTIRKVTVGLLTDLLVGKDTP